MKELRIKRGRLQSGTPVSFTLLIVMACDYYGVSDTLKGFAYALLFLVWVAWIYELFHIKIVDPFDEAIDWATLHQLHK